MSAEGRELCAITAAACREDGDGGMAASTQVRGLGEFLFERKGGGEVWDKVNWSPRLPVLGERRLRQPEIHGGYLFSKGRCCCLPYIVHGVDVSIPRSIRE